MVKFLFLDTQETTALPAQHPGLPPFDPGLLATHGCDAHVCVVRDDAVVARGSLWWKDAPRLVGQLPGVVGHFAAVDASGALELLDAACMELARRGCTLAVGPMDGNTWRRYRLLTERGDEKPFFMEPDNPGEWPAFFEKAQFTPLASYFSALNQDLSVEDPRLPRTMERLDRAGITLRTLRTDDFTGELGRIYAISRESFQNNFLYTPISEEAFIAQYEPIRAHINPGLVIIADCGNGPIGYVFAIPNLAQAARGEAVDTVVLKTVAVLPGRMNAGLGGVLVARCQQAARSLGYSRVIHALMHESNSSLNLSGHYATPFRRYTLYSRPLANGA
ncbi:MAG: GNAT family N-acetyltransferase [Chthoniobacteraceae bacterium]